MWKTKTHPKMLLEKRMERAIKSGDLARIKMVAELGVGEFSPELLGHGVISGALGGDLRVVEFLVKGLKADARFAEDSALRWAAVLKRDEIVRFLAQRVFSVRRWRRRTKEEALAEVKILKERIGRSCEELKKPAEVEKRAMEIVEEEAARLIERLGAKW